MDFVFQKVDLGVALKIVAWDYPAPYHVYNVHGSPLALARFIDGPYFAALWGEELIGFFCYGVAAQLNGKKDNELYREREYLDVGLGMHPAWCGSGQGLRFVRSGLQFAKHQGWLKGFRLTVASNNTRALKVYSRLGFQEMGRIAWHSRVMCDFVVMTLDNFGPTPPVALVD